MSAVAIVVVALWVAASTVWSFAAPMPEGAFDDIEAYRAVFFHVPLAWTGCVAFVMAAVHAARYLRDRSPLTDAAAWGAAEAGLVLTILGTVTGMVFAASQWHRAWNWDPRQTSVALVMLLYAAYLLFRASIADDALRARLSAAYLLLAVAPMIWLVMIYPRTAEASLHPVRAPFEALHWRIMLVNFAGYLGLFALIARLQAGIARLTFREAR